MIFPQLHPGKIPICIPVMQVSWRGDGDSLYSLLLVDNGIASLNGSQFVHWFLVNIPGTEPDRGTETIEYIEPFSAELKVISDF